MIDERGLTLVITMHTSQAVYLQDLEPDGHFTCHRHMVAPLKADVRADDQ